MKKLIFIFVLALLVPAAAAAQGTGFNFQGRLNDGTNPANGSYDLQFRLYDTIAGGTQIGAVVSRPATTLSNGVFSVTLDFGATAFNNPNSIFIEISVKPNGSTVAYTILGPRQQLTVVPFAVRAANATNADNAVNAQNSVNSQNTVNAQNSINSTNAINAQNSVNATNSQNSVNATNATNATTATNALSLGNVAASGWTRLNVQNTGDVLLDGRLQINGNATQLSNSNGLVKAMRMVDGETVNAAILRCYNGNTGAGTTTGNCGFTVTEPIFGVYRIDFGFQITNRFVSITPEYNSGGSLTQRNIGANYRFFDSTTIEVFTFKANNAVDTGIGSFTLIMY